MTQAAAVELFGHPDWCEPGECNASEWLSYHRSIEHRISTPAGAVEIGAQLRCNAYDPLPDAPVSIKLTFAHSDDAGTVSYHLDAPTIVRLHALLGDLLPGLSAHDFTEAMSQTQVQAVTEQSAVGYGIVVERGTDDTYGAWCPELPGCIAIGETLKGTVAQMRRAVQLHIAMLRGRGEFTPAPATVWTDLIPDKTANAAYPPGC
jgi:predicted RNase H-like HicB family nuclease